MGDSQRLRRPEEMATTSTAVSTVSQQIQEEPVQPIAVITLRPTRTQERKKVVWTEDTVDNENMNKKKSKCCCIYEKPRKFGESESESSDDECEHCFGHVEKKKHRHHHQQASTSNEAKSQIVEESEGSATITLKPGEPSAPDNPHDPQKPRPSG